MSQTPNDQLSLAIKYVKVIFREAYKHKIKAAIGFAVIAIGVMCAGLVASKTYTTSATLYADRANIIRPLLSGQASITTVQDQTRVVRESIFSPRVLNKVVEQAGLLTDSDTPAEIEKKTNALRRSLKVKGIGGSYIRVNYASGDADRTFKVLTSVLDIFIRDSSESKRSESRQAYEFINSQVESYKAQLQDAEQNLRAFKAGSTDGSEAAVTGRIASLRGTVESLELDIEGVRTRIAGIEAELGKESQFVAQQHKAGVYRNSLIKAQQQMDLLLLSYTETHPDVVALKFQIEDLKRSLAGANSAQTQDDVSVNPLYEGLRGELSTAKVNLKTRLRRLASTRTLLREEHERLKRVAGNQADLSELTRDYNVTRSIYEDMLERKEKARLSMALDVEGRGLNYKIQDPPAYPLNPTGMRLSHYMLIGLFLGLAAPIGVLVGLIIIDPRIRFASQLTNYGDLQVLGVVGHTSSALRSRIFNADVISFTVIFLVVFAVYGAVIFYKMTG